MPIIALHTVRPEGGGYKAQWVGGDVVAPCNHRVFLLLGNHSAI